MASNGWYVNRVRDENYEAPHCSRQLFRQIFFAAAKKNSQFFFVFQSLAYRRDEMMQVDMAAWDISFVLNFHGICNWSLLF